MTRDEANSVLEDFLYWHTQSSSYRDDYLASKKAVLDAMTQSDTISELQRDIERLKRALYKYGNHKADWCDNSSATVEDGTIAKLTLAGKSVFDGQQELASQPSLESSKYEARSKRGSCY